MKMQNNIINLYAIFQISISLIALHCSVCAYKFAQIQPPCRQAVGNSFIAYCKTVGRRRNFAKDIDINLSRKMMQSREGMQFLIHMDAFTHGQALCNLFHL